MGRTRRLAFRLPLVPLLRLSIVLLALGSLAGTAGAHELGGTRFDAPVPLAALFAGAGATVALTAVVSARTVGGSSATARRFVRVPARIARPLRLALRVGFLVTFALVVADGLVGRQVAAENLATVVVWPLWIDGLALVAALVGSPWRVLSPWRTLYDALVAVEGEEIALADYPPRLGHWPALAGFVLLVGVAENLTLLPRSPLGTSLLLLALTAVMLLGGVAFGPAWFDRADPLGVLYRLFGRVAPVRLSRTADGGYDLVARPPWTGCVPPVGSRSLAWFAAATVYTVSFDGFTATPEYQSLVLGLADPAVVPLGLVGVPLYVAGLLCFVAVFSAVARLAVRIDGGDGGDARGDRDDPRGATLAFAPTLLPIAVAYHLAHYYGYVAVNLGLAAGLVLEAATGVETTVSLLGWLPLPAFWASQVLLIVAGHVVAVVAAHHVARARTDSARAAWRAHLPLVVLMVGYTVLSLWIVSRPVAT